MDQHEGLNRAAAYCSRQERCVSEVQKKLIDWEVNENHFGAIIDKLKQEKFIDEHRYSNFYARDKFRFNGWGRIKIRWHMQQKKIAEQCIQEALESIDESDYLDKLNQLLMNKQKQIKNKEAHLQRASLLRFAQSRGFEASLTYPLVDKLMNPDIK